MNRNSLTLASFIMALAPQVSHAIVTPLEGNRFAAGVPTTCFEFFAAPKTEGRQRAANWCWAACIQMVLNSHGLKVTQEDVVQRTFGTRIDAPGELQDLLKALSGWAPSTLGGYWQIKVNIRDLSDGRFIDDLAKNCARIVGLKGDPIGHACVLTAVEYGLRGPRDPVIDKYILRDPNPSAESRIELNRADFEKRCIFNVGVYVIPPPGWQPQPSQDLQNPVPGGPKAVAEQRVSNMTPGNQGESSTVRPDMSESEVPTRQPFSMNSPDVSEGEVLTRRSFSIKADASNYRLWLDKAIPVRDSSEDFHHLYVWYHYGEQRNIANTTFVTPHSYYVNRAIKAGLWLYPRNPMRENGRPDILIMNIPCDLPKEAEKEIADTGGVYTWSDEQWLLRIVIKSVQLVAEEQQPGEVRDGVPVQYILNNCSGEIVVIKRPTAEKPGAHAGPSVPNRIEQPKESKGSEITRSTLTNTKYCMQCGKRIPAQAKFCPECGSRQEILGIEQLTNEGGQNLLAADLGMEMVYIEPGSFPMGSDGGDSNEKPVHTVRISRAFWMGKCEVTQAQYQAVMGTNPSSFEGSDLPVETVSWDDAVAFCQRLTERERQAGRLPAGCVYRLPTEAEWEYAARGGNKSRGFAYSGSNTRDDVAWNVSNSDNRTHPVGGQKANELGLCDMSGNVWEWCHDSYDKGYYAKSPSSDPTGASSSGLRVRRGGSGISHPWFCRVTIRNGYSPDNRRDDDGFRVVASWPLD